MKNLTIAFSILFFLFGSISCIWAKTQRLCGKWNYFFDGNKISLDIEMDGEMEVTYYYKDIEKFEWSGKWKLDQSTLIFSINKLSRKNYKTGVSSKEGKKQTWNIAYTMDNDSIIFLTCSEFPKDKDGFCTASNTPYGRNFEYQFQE